MQVVGVRDGFSGLLDCRWQALSSSETRDLIYMGGTILGTTNRSNPFAWQDGDRVIDRSDEVVENAAQEGLDAVIVIGGDGTLRIAAELAKKGLRVVGVPKTIDNDLQATDYTFGFWTAIDIATDALDRLRDTAESHHRVMILEVMGRDTGWIALHAGIAGGADVILIPELPYELGTVAEKIEERRNRGQAFSLVVVAEGAVAQGDRPSYLDADRRRLGGAGDRLARDLRPLIEHEIRVTVLGHLQRGGTPVPYDRILATRFGEHAVELVSQQHYDRMVCLQGASVTDVDLEQAVQRVKCVDPESELVRTARCVGTGFGISSIGPRERTSPQGLPRS